MNIRKFLLITVFVIAFALRFIRLGDIPVGFHRDEAFLGYNAYSILKTGRDMNGNFLPLHLESFIYSPAGYSYFTIPSILIFGLNPFSIRFPSAFFGSLTVVLTFLLVRKLFKEENYYNLAFFSSLFLALSPWHINLSRTSTENTIVGFFITLGSLLFLAWAQNKKSYILITSFASFGITFLIYQAPRAFLPFFIPLLIYSFIKGKTTERNFSLALFLVVIVLPLFLILKSPDLSSRIRSLNIFSHPETQLSLDESIREDGVSNLPNVIPRAFHNKYIGYSSLVLDNYFKHFSYSFLFTDNGLPERFKVPGMGLFYILELPLILLGILFLLRQKKNAVFLLGWVILAPIGSSLTFDDVPNLQRTLILFPALSIISAGGFILFLQLLSKFKYKRLLFSIISLLFIYNVSFYLHQYYVHQVRHHPWFRNEGYKNLVENVNTYLPNYKKAVITNRETAPTIFFLFFGKYDPKKFQEEAKGGFGINSDSVNFYKYFFTDKECPLRTLNPSEKTDEKMYDLLNTGDRGVLYVNSSNCKSPKIPVNLLSEIKRSDGSVVFRIYDVK